jgi:hypothetical protein
VSGKLVAGKLVAGKRVAGNVSFLSQAEMSF